MNKRIKYSYEEKLKAVLSVVKNHQSMQSAATETGCTRKAVSLWVSQYKHFGKTGLLSIKNNSYTESFKLLVVRHMNKNHLSLLKTAMTFSIPDPTVVLRWKRKYEKEGETVFMPDNRDEELKKEKRKRNLEGKTKEELVKEVEYLEVENAYLKKLRDLVQKREAGKRQKPSGN
jgi:transposase